MKRTVICFFIIFIFFEGTVLFLDQVFGAEKKQEYLLPGNIKEGWKIFTTKKCSLCHSIWGEGGKGGARPRLPSRILCQPISTCSPHVEPRTGHVGENVIQKNSLSEN